LTDEAIFIVVVLESAGVPLSGETILVSAAAFAGNRHSLDIRYVTSLRRLQAGRSLATTSVFGSAGYLARHCLRGDI
jgi:hypothetical protein